ncbi:anthranilate synthase component I [Rossellomorea aquimaris]|uniref:Anthranilate synthase component 1 n=1 Tax=Rossellomorea aquimaris TaxID=189382 RepID=A0A5D4TLR8_9BACI|nr:anthranilate synthase component I [Rossellomorea aquimaris]TYS75174.1 anthranilate synthase component I [Rossellomorea aquimaris]TYS79551.1 anthranilate synthase component I [Rossellomorea aquimaris]
MMKQQALDYVVKELNGDIFTPISLFQSLKGKKKYLLESSLKHEQSGRYSFVGSDPFLECKAYGNAVQLKKSSVNEIDEIEGNPIEIIQSLIPSNQLEGAPFPFTGGGIGYLGYDVIRHYEDIGITPQDELEMPDIHLMFYEKVIVFDHLEHKVFIVVMNEWTEDHIGDLDKKVMEVEAELNNVYLKTHKKELDRLSFHAQTSKDEFMEKVERAKRSIGEGEIFQVVLSQRLKASFSGDPFSFYRSLRKSNPSPYMFFIDFEDYVVMGASPESLLKVQGREITTNPIAGTRRRGETHDLDRELEKELLTDEKEIAEHRMLVDLGRNDLGRVCEIGSIYLSKYLTIERYKYVMHIVSEVKGELKEEVTPLEALSNCLPAGTVSGAPKIRAMQIINELETTKRGVYSGAVGYIGVNGNLDFALAIRTMVLKDKTAYVQAGAGIVYDSDPASEYEETMNKAKSLLEVTG